MQLIQNFNPKIFTELFCIKLFL